MGATPCSFSSRTCSDHRNACLDKSQEDCDEWTKLKIHPEVRDAWNKIEGRDE